MGKARDWALVVFIGVAWSEGAWAQSCGDVDHPGPVCVDGQDYDSLYEAVVYADDAGLSIVEVTESYDPAEDSYCVPLNLSGASDIRLQALSDSVRWPGIKVQGGALALTGGTFVGACGLSYSERVTEWDSSTTTNIVVLKSYTTSAQLIAVESSLSLNGVVFDYAQAQEEDPLLGALFLWDSSLAASMSTSFTGYPRQGAVEIVSHEQDVAVAFEDVNFNSNQALALVMRLTLYASMERVDALGDPDEPIFTATLTGVHFESNSPGYGITADIAVDELASLSITDGLHIGLGGSGGGDGGISMYALDTHVTLTDTQVMSYERGMSVGAADGIFETALDEYEDVSLSIRGGSFSSIYNGDDHGGAITASSGEIELSGVTASDLTSPYAPFLKAYHAPSLLIEDLNLTSFVITQAPSAAIHVTQVDSVILRRVAVCDGQSSKTDAGGGVALYLTTDSGENQTVEVHNLAFWGNRYGEGQFPAAIHAEHVKSLSVKHSTFVGSDEPTGRDAYAVRLEDLSLRIRWTFTSNIVQGLTKGLSTHYADADTSTNPLEHELDYALFFDVDYPLIEDLNEESDPYRITENVALNTDAAGFWSAFNPVDCTTPPLLGVGAYALDKGDPREGDLDDDGSLPDLGAYSGLYADELPDADGDGFRLGFDCDDSDADVYPGQLDIPLDGVDNDCDGQDAPGSGDTGDDTGADDTGDPLQFDYFGGCSCGGSGVDTGGAAALLFLGGFMRRRRRRG
ncbi:MAG: putative metal-binding motif-containing protein [Deltaproteobacteria bacterium]|nr:putative metal-binding motif-containing protein [Deltaproteobacteria bacterium]